MASTRTRIPISELDPRQALYELQSYQEELELQNIELLKARKENELLIEKYTTLYDQSPSGYLTLDRNGRIVELNFVALFYLYKDRQEVIEIDFRQFISPETQQIYDEFFHNIFEKTTKITCEVSISVYGNARVFAHLEGIAINDGENCLITIVDITVLKQTEAALSLSRKEFQSYFENSTVGMSVFSPEEGWLELNQRLCQLFGYSKKELIGKSWMDLSHPEDLPANMALYQQAQEGKLDRYQMDKRFIRKDGGILYATLSVAVQRNEDGTIHHLLSSYIDKTDQKLAEIALRESEEKYRSLLELAPYAFFLGDADGNFDFVNDKAVELTGYSKEKLLSMNIEDMFPDDVLKEKPLQYEDLKLGKVITSEREVIKKNGKRIHVEMSSKKMPDDSYQCLMWDITHRKQAEVALMKSEQKYRKLHENMMDGYVSADMEGNIKDSNKALRVMLGYSAKELNLLTYEDITPEKWHNYEQNIVTSQVLIRGYSDIYEKEYIKKDGTIIPVEFRTYLVRDHSDEPEGMWAIVRDISEHKRSAKELIESEERFRILFEESPFAIILADIESGFIINANHFACNILGKTIDQIIGMHQSQLHPPRVELSSKLNFQNHIEELKLSGTARPIELPVLCSDGTEVPVEIVANIITINGKQVLQGIFRDISERKEAEKAIRENEERLREISKTDWVWEVDKDGFYTYTSQTGVEFFGFTKEELLGKTPFDFMPPDEAKRMASIFSGIAARKAPIVDLENWNVKKNGELFCVVTNGVPILDDEGNLKGYRGVDKDITKRKLAEEKLRESNEE